MFLIEVTHEVLNLAQAGKVTYALGPLVIPLVMAGIQLGTSIFKGIKADKEKKEALAAINNYERQDRTNVFKDQPWYNSQAKLAAENQLRQNQATSVSAAMQGGAKTYGIIESAQRQADQATLKLNADIQDKYLSHTDRIAKDEARLQSMTQKDELVDIYGLSALYEASRQDQASAITEGGQALAFAGANIVGAKSGTTTTDMPVDTTYSPVITGLNDSSFDNPDDIYYNK